MTHEEAKEELRKLVTDNQDVELCHVAADDVLCRLLESLGYADIVELYHQVDKWYA